jgi:hypothetical protein
VPEVRHAQAPLRTGGPRAFRPSRGRHGHGRKGREWSRYSTTQPAFRFLVGSHGRARGRQGHLQHRPEVRISRHGLDSRGLVLPSGSTATTVIEVGRRQVVQVPDGRGALRTPVPLQQEGAQRRPARRWWSRWGAAGRTQQLVPRRHRCALAQVVAPLPGQADVLAIPVAGVAVLRVRGCPAGPRTGWRTPSKPAARSTCTMPLAGYAPVQAEAVAHGLQVDAGTGGLPDAPSWRTRPRNGTGLGQRAGGTRPVRPHLRDAGTFSPARLDAVNRDGDILDVAWRPAARSAWSPAPTRSQGLA